MVNSGARKTFGGIAQLVERLVRNEKVRGSNPLTSSLDVEQRRQWLPRGVVSEGGLCVALPVEGSKTTAWPAGILAAS